MNTALNRTGVVFLTNESGGDVAQGDVVIVDDANAGSFTTTTTAGFSDSQVGVVLDVNGIANNATGAVAFSGWVPVINLDGAATLGDFVQTDTVAGQGTPHAAPQEEGDFAQVLAASATPAAILFGSPNAAAGGGGGNVNAAGTLTDHALVLGDGSTDVTVVASLGTAGQFLESAGAGADPAWAYPGLTWIEQQTPTGTGTLTFSSLGSFTHLQIMYSARSTEVAVASNLFVRFNGDTGANYDYEQLRAVGAGVSAGETFASTSAFVGQITGASGTAGFAGTGTIFFPDAVGTAFQKTFQSVTQDRYGTSTGNYDVWQLAGAWRNTAALTSITLFLGGGNYDTGTKFTLYGLR